MYCVYNDHVLPYYYSYLKNLPNQILSQVFVAANLLFALISCKFCAHAVFQCAYASFICFQCANALLDCIQFAHVVLICFKCAHAAFNWIQCVYTAFNYVKLNFLDFLECIYPSVQWLPKCVQCMIFLKNSNVPINFMISIHMCCNRYGTLHEIVNCFVEFSSASLSMCSLWSFVLLNGQ